jgi:hypothetical protein
MILEFVYASRETLSEMVAALSDVNGAAAFSKKHIYGNPVDFKDNRRQLTEHASDKWWNYNKRPLPGNYIPPLEHVK